MSDRENRVSLMVYVVVGHLLFFGLLVLSLKYYHERTIYVDSAYQIFKWIQMEGLQFEAYRFTAIFPQLAVKLVKLISSDAATLLLTASASHILVGWGIFTICAHVLKQKWLAVACALAAVLCTRLSFYAAVLEIHYLLSYPFLLMGILAHRVDDSRFKTYHIILAGLCLILTLMVHPLGFMIALFVLVFLFFVSDQNKLIISISIILSVLWGVFGRLLLPPTEYEHGLYSSVVGGIAALQNLSDFPSFRLLIDHTWEITSHYLFTWIFLITSLILMLKRKDYLLAGFVLFSSVGFILLTIVTYHEGESAIMLEKSFIPLATLVSIPFVFEISFLPARWKTIMIFPVVFALFFQFRAISFASRPLTERYVTLTEMIDETREKGITKRIVSAQKLEELGIDVHWALPFESIMSSSLQDRDSAVALISSEEIHLIKSDDFHPWYNRSNLTEEFFKLPESNYEPAE